jgi:hypothetical protein
MYAIAEENGSSHVLLYDIDASRDQLKDIMFL